MRTIHFGPQKYYIKSPTIYQLRDEPRYAGRTLERFLI